MAFIISRQPATWSPVYNHLTYRVFSSNYTKPSMKYIFDLYVNGSLVNTSKLFPRNDGYCNFDPSKIIQNYLTEWFNNNINTGTYSNPSETATYYIVFKEEYINGSTLTTTTLSTGSKKYTWIAALQWEEGKNLDSLAIKLQPTQANDQQDTAAEWCTVRKYTPDISNNLFNPLYANRIGINERRVETLMIKNWNTLWAPNSFWVIVKGKNHPTNKIFYKNISISTSTTDPRYQFWHQPVGISQLNSISWTGKFIPPGTSNYINPDEDDMYAFIFFRNVGGFSYLTHKIVTYLIDDCNKYKRYTIIYKHPYGGWGHIVMNKKSFQKETTSRSIMDTFVPYDYSTASYSTKVSAINTRGSIELNSGWITSDYDVQNIVDMLRSPVIYLMDENNIIIPVVLKESEYNVKSVTQDKMVEYNIKFKEAFDKNTTI